MSLSTTPTDALTFQALGTLGLAGAEISAFDAATARLFVTSSVGLQVVDLSDPSAPSLVTTIDMEALGFLSNNISSVAAKFGNVAVALQDDDKSLPGQVVILNAATLVAAGAVTVGAHPDMVTFTPDGSKVLVANEGEYLEDNLGSGREGSVSIIGEDANGFYVQTADFAAFNKDLVALRAEGLRIFAGQTVAQDVEPEYIAISPDGKTAMVTLQEANAVAILDIETATFTKIVPLGLKDFSGLQADFSDRDGGINLTTGNPVFGIYMPDAIDSYEAGGQAYYVIANEGDDRDDFITPEETDRLGDFDLDDTAFPDEATLQEDANLGRLIVTNAPLAGGDLDGDGDLDQIQMLGGRSFSILDSTGAIVFDSGDIIERIVADQFPSRWDDGRSDNKGPEPEGVEIATIDGATYAFVGLERTSITLVFDVTDPTAVTYTGALENAGDISPEGGIFISAEDSPTGEALFVVSNEVSNTVTAYEILVPPKPAFTLQILHASDWEGGVAAVERAPNFAAIVDALEDTYANSITLTSGDNFIPGPFTAAGTDPSVRDEIASFYEQLFGLNPGALTGIRNSTLPFNAADVAILNAVGVQASVFGNHEFDLGTNALNAAINSAVSSGAVSNIGVLFPYLTANVNLGPTELAGLVTQNLLNATEFGFRASDFNANGTLANAAGASRPQAAPWTIIEENGEQIGVLGITTQILAAISSLGNGTVADPAGDGGVDNMQELADILQPLVDQMTALGLDKIILLAHLQQIGNERELATLLSGVDIILGGGSNTIFADGTDVIEAGDVVGGTYPEIYTGADGKPVALVNTDGNYNYVGRLVVSFDEDGVIIPGSIDPDVSGAYVTDEAGVDAVAGNGDGTLDQAEQDAIFADGTRGGEVKQIADAIGAVIQAKDGNVLGFTDVFLEGRRSLVRSEETNLGNLTADANLAVAKSFDIETVISLKNGGGIRAEIGTVLGQPIPDLLPPQANPDAGKPEGGISQLDIENSLRFNNGLSLLTLSAQGIVNMLENAVRGANPGATPGAFPQISGLKFSWDKDRPTLDRVVDVAVVDQQGNVIDVLAENGALVGDPTREFRLVTLNFLSPDNAADLRGGDDIIVQGATVNDTAPGAASGTLAVYTDFAALNRVDLYDPAASADFATAGREQAALADVLSALHGTEDAAYAEAETGRDQDERVQNLDFRASDVIGGGADPEAGEDNVVVGTSGDNDIVAFRGDDSIWGVGGNDEIFGLRGDDMILGGVGNDTAIGGNGNDTLMGGDGDDVLRGGGDDDVINGGAGNDTLVGGAGADSFIFDGAAGEDRLTGFVSGEDELVLTGLGFADFAAVQAAMQETARGVVLTLDDDSSVLLRGATIAGILETDVVLI